MFVFVSPPAAVPAGKILATCQASRARRHLERHCNNAQFTFPMPEQEPPCPRKALNLMSDPTLLPAQAHALFDILTHHETYAEIENFKWPDAIDNYGYPFKKEDGVQTSSPLLQMLLNKFALKLPGLSNVAPEFWQERCQILVAKLGGAELSESYDKGVIGARKTLATAISALLEYLARGCLGGFPRKEIKNTERKYDTTKAEDVLRAWDDALQGLIYGDLIDELFDKTAETGRLEDHSSLVQAAHEFILLK